MSESSYSHILEEVEKVEEELYYYQEEVNIVEEAQSSRVPSYGRGVDDQPNKRLKVCVDRISQLPEALLAHILSLMPTKYAVRTSVLSKRWLHVWTLTTALIYDFDGKTKDLEKFDKFVDRTLILHKSSNICKFEFRSRSTYNIQDSIKLWLHAAAIKHVEQLIVEPKLGGSYELPYGLYTCESLRRMSLSYCDFIPSCSTLNWRSLSHLSLRHVRLQDDLIQKLLAGSPLLEYLKLKSCAGFSRIDITSEKLKRLIIDGYSDTSECGWLDLYAPHLCSLEIQGFMAEKKCRLKDIASLVHASFTFLMRYWGDLDSDSDNDSDDVLNLRICEHTCMVRALMDAVRRVENLSLATWIVEVLSYNEVKGFHHFNSSRKSLILKIGLLPYDLLGIEVLLQTSPFLETLVIDMSHSNLHQQIFDCEELQGLNSNTYLQGKKMLSQHLRTVEIIGFSYHVTKLSEFLLKKAKLLEKIILRSNKSQTYVGGNFFNIY